MNKIRGHVDSNVICVKYDKTPKKLILKISQPPFKSMTITTLVELIPKAFSRHNLHLRPSHEPISNSVLVPCLKYEKPNSSNISGSIKDSLISLRFNNAAIRRDKDQNGAKVFHDLPSSRRKNSCQDLLWFCYFVTALVFLSRKYFSCEPNDSSSQSTSFRTL